MPLAKRTSNRRHIAYMRLRALDLPKDWAENLAHAYNLASRYYRKDKHPAEKRITKESILQWLQVCLEPYNKKQSKEKGEDQFEHYLANFDAYSEAETSRIEWILEARTRRNLKRGLKDLINAGLIVERQNPRRLMLQNDIATPSR